MQIHLSFENYDEIEKLCQTSVDAHPEEIVLTIDGMHADTPQPRHRKALCDDELTMDELCFYEVGRLHVYYHLMELGMYTIEDVADVLDLDVETLSMVHHIWETVKSWNVETQCTKC